MNYGGLLGALGAASAAATGSKTRAASGLQPPLSVDHHLRSGSGSGSVVAHNDEGFDDTGGTARLAIKGSGGAGGGGGDGDDPQAKDAGLGVFRTAPLPHARTHDEPRTTTQWIVESAHQTLGGSNPKEAGSDAVLRCVPYEILRAVRQTDDDAAAAEDDDPSDARPTRQPSGRVRFGQAPGSGQRHRRLRASSAASSSDAAQDAPASASASASHGRFKPRPQSRTQLARRRGDDNDGGGNDGLVSTLADALRIHNGGVPTATGGGGGTCPIGGSGSGATSPREPAAHLPSPSDLEALRVQWLQARRQQPRYACPPSPAAPSAAAQLAIAMASSSASASSPPPQDRPPPPRLAELKNVGVSGGAGRPTSALPRLAGVREPSAVPGSKAPVRIKRRVSTNLLLSQPFDDVLEQYPKFAARYRALGRQDQSVWRAMWGGRSQTLHARIEQYLAAGLFTEGVRDRVYCELFQSGVFVSYR